MGTLHARLAAASGAAAAGVAVLMLSHRVVGTIPALLLLAVVARASGAACALSGSPMAAAAAHETLARQAGFAVAWAAVVAAGCIRAGSTLIEDVAGAHAVAGLGVIRGPILTVAGLWLCALAAAVAISGSAMLSPAGHEAPSPAAAGRLDLTGAGVQIGLATALLAGPQIRSATDAVAWGIAAVALAVWAWFGRSVVTVRSAPLIASAAAYLGLILVVIGGRP